MESLSILLVDDDADVRFAVGKLLSQASHRVTAVADSKHAHDAMARTQFNVILTDMLLEEGDATEILRTARRVQRNARLLVMSGGSAWLDRSYCAKLGLAFGATASLLKPFTNEELLAAVEGSALQTVG